MVSLEELEEFVISILDESESDIYGCITRGSKDEPTWCLFFLIDDSDGKRYCGGHFPLCCTDMTSLLNVFSIFSKRNRKIIVDAKGYFESYGL